MCIQKGRYLTLPKPDEKLRCTSRCCGDRGQKQCPAINTTGPCSSTDCCEQVLTCKLNYHTKCHVYLLRLVSFSKTLACTHIVEASKSPRYRSHAHFPRSIPGLHHPRLLSSFALSLAWSSNHIPRSLISDRLPAIYGETTLRDKTTSYVGAC